MRPLGLRGWLMLSHASFALALVLVGTAGITISLNRARGASAALDAERDAAIAAARVARAGGDSVRIGVVVRDEQQHRDLMAVVDSDGHIVAGDLGARPSRLMHQEVDQALAGDSASAYDSKHHRGIAAAPVVQARDVNAAVVLVERAPPLVPWRGALGLTTAVGVILIAAGGLAGWALAGVVARPLRRLTDVAHAAALGGAPTSDRSRSRVPEIATLAAAVDRLSRRASALSRAVVQPTDSDDATALRRFSHQLRTPIGIIELRLDELATKIGDRDRQREIVAIVSRQVDVLDDVSLRLGAYLRDRAPMPRQTIEVSSAVAAVVPRLKPLATWSGIKVVVAPGPDVKVFVDPTALEDSISNVVENAIKFSPAGGRVWVSWSVDSPNVTVSVEDEGPGLPPDERDAVRRAWARGSNAQGTPGMGLGLSLVEDFVAAERGRFDLDRSDRGGLAARITLPCAQ